ncbi:MAG: hypothetical protein O7G32_11485 [SAR324 cluster bacterium]|nr:hypothetical protein [SAR324 cluster bacterium]
MAKTNTSRRRVGPVDWSEVSTLAGYGLTEAEIHAKLELPGALSGNELEAFTAAIHQGRLLSSAEVKQAQHKAALNGQVTAQGRLLELLNSESDDEDVRFVREPYEIDGQDTQA